MSEARKAKPEQLKEIVALSDRVFRSPQQVSMGAAFKALFSEENAENLWIVEDDGKTVSLMGLMPATLNIAGCRVPIASMGSVCTDAEYRGKNYASRLMQLSLQQLYDEEKAFLFISGDRGLYLRNDSMVVGQTQRFRIHSPVQLVQPDDGSDDPFTISLWQQEDTAAMLKVLQSEQAYFERSIGQFLELIEGGSLLSCYSAKQHILVSRADGELNAYIVFGTSQKEDNILGEVIEFAGDDRSVIRLMKEAMERFGTAELTVSVANYRANLAQRLVSLGNSFRTQSTPGTIRMIHFPALWNSLTPRFEAELGAETANRLRLEEANKEFRISLGAESIVVDLRMATSLVFNGPHLIENSPLKEALSRVFPIPLVNPNNLNYI